MSNWEDSGYNSWGRESSGSANLPVANVTPDDMRREYERLISGQGLTQALDVKTDKDGKARWMFMTLPADVAGLLQYGLNVMKPWLNQKGINYLYDRTSDAWKKYSKNPALSETAKNAAAHNAGLNAAKIFTAALIGAEPLSDLVRVRTEYSRERKELLKDLSPAIDASEGRYKNNEVIRKSLDRVHDRAMVNLQKFAADLPTIALISAYAVMDYGNLRDRETRKLKQKALHDKPENEIHSELEQVANQRDKFLYEQEQKFFEAHKEEINPRTHKKYTAQELEQRWELKQKELVAGFRAKDKARYSIQHTTDQQRKTDRDSTMLPAMIGVGGLSQILKSRLGKDGERANRKIALDLILDLKQKIDEEGEVYDLKQRIVEIFQQNERDHGRDIVGPKLMSKLDPAVNAIADVIADGRLNPLALINLVGEGKIIIRDRKGMRQFASAQRADELISEQLKVLSSRELMKAEEFFANFADPLMVEQTLKNNLANMKGTEKALFASLFPEDILLRAGLKRREIVELHKQAHEHMYGFVAASVMAMAQQDPEQLKKAGIPDEDIAKLKEFSERLEQEGISAVKAAVDGKDKSMLDIVRTSGLNEQITTGKSPWTERVQAARSTHERLAQIIQEKEPEPFGSGDRRDRNREERGEDMATAREMKRRRKRGPEASEELLGV